MKIESKYNIGDKVRFIRERRGEVWHDCEFCGGSGEAIDYMGRTVECPDCEGSGGYWDSEYVEETAEGTISSIFFEGYVDAIHTSTSFSYGIVVSNKALTQDVKERNIIEVVI